MEPPKSGPGLAGLLPRRGLRVVAGGAGSPEKSRQASAWFTMLSQRAILRGCGSLCVCQSQADEMPELTLELVGPQSSGQLNRQIPGRKESVPITDALRTFWKCVGTLSGEWRDPHLLFQIDWQQFATQRLRVAA